MAGAFGILDRCTSAFVAYQGFTTNPTNPPLTTQEFIVTAGHCGGVGRVFSAGRTTPITIGQVARTTYNQASTNIDLSLIDAPSGRTPQVYVTDTLRVNVNAAQINNQDAAGQRVCKYGTTSHQACGAISSINMSVRYPGSLVTLTRQRIASVFVQGGDSGGPVFDLAGGVLTARGIVSGSLTYADGRVELIYSHIDYLRSEGNVAPARR